jgi:hypothetical protein
MSSTSEPGPRDPAEIAKTLRYLMGARAHAERTAGALERSGAEPHLLAALRVSERELSAAVHRLGARAQDGAADRHR